MYGNILEVSKRSSKGGRVPIKIALLKIHEDLTETNKNGLHWNEEFVANAIESVKSIPICAEFCTDKKDVPLGHGLTGVEVNADGLSEPVYKNSETVGVIEDAEIQEIEINNSKIKALVGSGVLFFQRYPNFVKWVRQHYALGEVDTSIEIMGTAENNNKIVYLEDEPKQEYRTPKEFLFSGTAILSMSPADDDAVIVEVAQKQDKEEKGMTEQEIMKIVQEAIADLNTAQADADAKIAEVNSEMVEKDAKIAELETQVESANGQIAEKDTQIAELNSKIEELNATIQENEKEKALGKLDVALAGYSEEEQKFAEAEINSYREDPLNGSLDAITSKICVGIVAKQKEDAKIAEQNADKHQDDIEDIFSEVSSFEDEAEEDISIF